MTVSAAEQYLIELINRARLDPLAEAARYTLSLNTGLADGLIDGSAKQVLAPNADLERAALDHSAWMLQSDTFSHEGENGSNPGERIEAAGYALTGAWTWRENLAWSGTTGQVNLETAIAGHHEGLYRSSGHRANTFAEDIREIGVGQIAGEFTHQGTDFNASMLTLNFAASGGDVFITGVAYRDSDGNAFYGIGEGRSDLRFSAEGTTASTSDAGGYGVAVSADDAVQVVVSDAGGQIARLAVDTTAGNVKLDVVTAADGGQSFALSGSATLVSGIADATLLGVGDLDLTGSAADNALNGNAGDNVLDGAGGDDVISGGKGADNVSGGAGDDVLRGGQGRDMRWDSVDTSGTETSANADVLNGGNGDDRLHGQSGSDTLNGGAGDDRMTGGSGRDIFIYTEGRDRVLDFDDNVDALHLDLSALGLADDTDVADVLGLGRVDAGNAVFDFGGGNVLTVNDISDLDLLSNDLVLF